MSPVLSCLCLLPNGRWRLGPVLHPPLPSCKDKPIRVGKRGALCMQKDLHFGHTSINSSSQVKPSLRLQCNHRANWLLRWVVGGIEWHFYSLSFTFSFAWQTKPHKRTVLPIILLWPMQIRHSHTNSLVAQSHREQSHFVLSQRQLRPVVTRISKKVDRWQMTGNLWNVHLIMRTHTGQVNRVTRQVHTWHLLQEPIRLN